MRSALALGMVLTFATVANACGNPAGRSKFEFTPAPYIVQPGINGTPWPIMEYEGQPVRADEVLLVVNADRLESIRSELIDLGFQVTQTSTPVLGMANLVVEVPLGSVAAASKPSDRSTASSTLARTDSSNCLMRIELDDCCRR